MNLNPRSIYNKLDEFQTFVEEEEIDVVFMSESHERSYPTKNGKSQKLEDVIKLKDYEVITSENQRKEKGGRPALIIDKNKFKVDKLNQSDIQTPSGVEIVWAVLTPFNTSSDSKIQKIVLASIYSKPNSKAKTKLTEHTYEVFTN